MFRTFWTNKVSTTFEFQIRPQDKIPENFIGCKFPLSKDGSFSFFGVTQNLSEIGWDSAKHEKLWHYNQHYFDFLITNEPDTATFGDNLIQDWIKNCHDGVGWDSYPTSIRVVNWIKRASQVQFSKHILVSIGIQTRWLEGRLEKHIGGNHLISNYKALIFAGVFFQTKESDGWLNKGLRGLRRELNSQILDDGGHFELSPMYHSIVLNDLLDIVNFLKSSSLCKKSANIRQQIYEISLLVEKMFAWLGNMTHPDFGVSFFNDSVFGIAPTSLELEEYAMRLGLVVVPKVSSNSVHLKESGYIRLVHGQSVVIMDVGDVGPKFLPAHAHADTLSLEASIAQQRVLVNSGISCYGISNERLRQRGTRAHNTVCFEDINSSEVWSGFRVARRADPLNVVTNFNSKVSKVQAAHNGYVKLRVGGIHERSVISRRNSLIIKDNFAGHDGNAHASFHFSPEVDVYFEDRRNVGLISKNEKTLGTFEVRIGQPELLHKTWHPEFGKSVPNRCLAITLVEGTSEIAFFWYGDIHSLSI